MQLTGLREYVNRTTTDDSFVQHYVDLLVAIGSLVDLEVSAETKTPHLLDMVQRAHELGFDKEREHYRTLFNIACPVVRK